MNKEKETLYGFWEEHRVISAEERFSDKIFLDEIRKKKCDEALLNQYVGKNMEIAFLGGFQIAMKLIFNLE